MKETSGVHPPKANDAYSPFPPHSFLPFPPFPSPLLFPLLLSPLPSLLSLRSRHPYS